MAFFVQPKHQCITAPLYNTKNGTEKKLTKRNN